MQPGLKTLGSDTDLVENSEEEGMHGGTVENAVHLGVGQVYLAGHLVWGPGRVLPFVGTAGPHTEVTTQEVYLTSNSNDSHGAVYLSRQCIYLMSHCAVSLCSDSNDIVQCIYLVTVMTQCSVSI